MILLRLLRRAYTRSGARDLLPNAAKQRLRRVWILVARRIGYPLSSPVVPRPPLAGRRERLRLTRVLLASDVNPHYLESWPLARRAWLEIGAAEPLLVLVAREEDVSSELIADELVRLFPPVEGVHTAFQAQCIRLLYPAMLDTSGAVLVSDMELCPLDPYYFHGPLAPLDARFFVSYRGDLFLHRREVAIPYNAARPDTWREIFEVDDEDGVRARLAEWAARVDYDGTRGGRGWYTDQLVLYRALMRWDARTHRLWTLDDDYTGYCRLDRPVLEAEGAFTERLRREVLGGRYTDFNSCVPHGRFRAVNEAVVDAGIEGVRRGRPRRRWRVSLRGTVR